MPTTNSANYSPVQYNVQTGGASGTLNSVSPGTAGLVFTSNGVSAQPSFQTLGLQVLGITAVNTSPYVVLSTDGFISVDSSGGAITIQLPNAPATGRTFTIKDQTGNAASNNISVTTVGGAVTIDGLTTYTINANYQSINVVFNGTSYMVF